MNPFRYRTARTILLMLAGLAITWLLAVVITPRWPGFCDETIYGAACEDVTRSTVWGYLTIALGIGNAIFGPIAGSLLHLWINGADWEQPRGRETVITNIPLLASAILIAAGVLIIVIG